MKADGQYRLEILMSCSKDDANYWAEELMGLLPTKFGAAITFGVETD